jgi:DivIVA domain-containing protein
MGVDQTSLDRIRNATFPSVRRGYDKHEVEKFLGRLADWLETGGGDESRSDAVKKELERVGQRTGAILAQAEDSAQQIRAEAEEEARGTINSANIQADEARSEAETYATETKAAAEREAREAIEAAQARARRIVEEAEQRREDAEAVIGNLIRRREDVIADTEELSRKLALAVEQHRSTDLRELDSLAGPEEVEEEDELAETQIAPDTDEADAVPPDTDEADVEVAPETDPGLEPEAGPEGQDTEEHTVTHEREIEPEPERQDLRT